uniref:AC5 n=1 Tax=Cotton leaf curl Multan virus TaxID=223252 RepID=A0A2Z4FS63_9GEMI|nr:AC5 [Cotton leaf curl Multan virus]
MNILHSRRTGLVVKHIEYLTKILRFVNRTSIADQKEHHRIRMILGLNILIHPYLTQNINRLDTKSLTNSMGQPSTTSNITNTHYFTYMLNIMSGLKRLYLTGTLTTPWNIRTSVHPIHSGLPVHGPVCPCLLFCDADNGGSSTAGVRAAEVQTPAYFRRGRRNDDIGSSLRHNYGSVIYKLNPVLTRTQEYLENNPATKVANISQIAYNETRAPYPGIRLLVDPTCFNLKLSAQVLIAEGALSKL